ncbi:hypothetical protein Pint_11467 [Pistacia integerrima]|uniref:Uncharacterized protein n=1 Tax=Pistacia integerrima TaxID=434235 RepID=A0ACC0XET4_9ROSI|nr:hypothetical protein Pint_11467 [Pistacia integerrima]
MPSSTLDCLGESPPVKRPSLRIAMIIKEINFIAKSILILSQTLSSTKLSTNQIVMERTSNDLGLGFSFDLGLGFSFLSTEDHKRAALLSFKPHLTDPSNLLSSWHGQNCCTWNGIHCLESLHVSAIDLRNPNPDSEKFIINMNSELVSMSNSTATALNGSFSSSLFSLTYLSYLDLSFNNFMHSNIPTGLANLTRLSYLNLSNAMFNGSITTQFFILTSSLRWLDISCSYRVPDYLPLSPNLSSTVQVRSGVYYSYLIGGNLSLSSLNFLLGLHNLRELKLSGVDLEKTSQSTKWAEPLMYLSNLHKLELSNCRIFGKLPAKQLLNLTSLSGLVMDFNSLSSPIPREFVNLTSLSELDFTNSNIRAPWPKLEILDISSTLVNGSLPSSFLFGQHHFTTPFPSTSPLAFDIQSEAP